MTLSITPLDAPFGAEITGLDPAILDHGGFARIREALDERGLLVFRGQQDLTPKQHIVFSRRFGELQIHVQAKFHLPGHPEILVISTVVENGQPIGLGDAGRYWHSDLSYMAEPSLGSLLHARELPAEGGDTIFADMRLAHAALPTPLREQIEGLTAIHDYAYRNNRQVANDPTVRPALTAAMAAAVPPVEQPVVRVHPGNGRLALFVNEGFTSHIVGYTAEESSRLLDLLFAHQVRADFQYRHRWQPGDLVMWDNRSLIHLAAGVPPGARRTMYRTTVKGDRPYGPLAATKLAMALS